MSLREYARKRDFQRTAEPKPARGRKDSAHRFVVQKHAASRLHYDFRLELDGSLKSWAVPKGFPYNRGDKRLAIQVEDHPLSYIDFEGIIPRGQYGGGTVMVWDRGTFDLVGPAKGLRDGKLHVDLHGKKLNGEWYLVQMREGKEWLLIRGGANVPPVSEQLEDTSALSGKSMAQLAQAPGAKAPREKASTPRPPMGKSRPKRSLRARSSPARSRKAGKVSGSFIAPMKAKLVAQVPDESGWIYEVKFDGFRALAIKEGRDVQLFSRNEKDFNGRFPEIAEAVAALDAPDCVLDGEIVALDAKGRSSFQKLQALELGEARPPLFFYLFDLLRLNRQDLRSRPLAERKRTLEKLLRGAPPELRFSASLPGTSEAVIAMARRHGFEGIIAKRDQSPYEAGLRSGAWRKIKFHLEQEFVIGGYTNPEGTRKFFGALLVGVYLGKELRFCGKVGTGFSEGSLKSLHAQFHKIRRTKCPFENLPETRRARYGQAITAAAMKRCHWLQPILVGQVRFGEWTRDGKLRQPAFLGLREDKDATEVVQEKNP